MARSGKKKAGSTERRMQNSRAPARRGSHAAAKNEAAIEHASGSIAGVTASGNDTTNDDQPIPKPENSVPSPMGQLRITAFYNPCSTHNPLSRAPLEALQTQYDLMQTTILSQGSQLFAYSRQNTELASALDIQMTATDHANAARKADALTHAVQLERVKQTCRETIECARAGEDGWKERAEEAEKGNGILKARLKLRDMEIVELKPLQGEVERLRAVVQSMRVNAAKAKEAGGLMTFFIEQMDEDLKVETENQPQGEV